MGRVVFNREEDGFLQEEGRETDKKTKFGNNLFILGWVVIAVGVFIVGLAELLTPKSITTSMFLGAIIIVGGLLLSGLGIVVSRRYGRTNNSDFSPQSCPSCKKLLPEGNFEFCPFCGHSLKSL